MKHEILFLNSNRAYVLVKDVWYDTVRDSNPVIGQSFLLGKIEKILDYESYIAEYPESTDEIYNHVTDKTISGGYLRRSMDGVVAYGVNPATLQVGSSSKKEAILD